ncbi:hypothetical protein [Haloarcula nitratireducens]|uniref:Proliferating cell nuclear antigen PCNA N-terminal domain-containing protein n=1 Tax=Haloarcula nitratireducens TaxID=2487749 RepID=A0AAW4PG52_9EURY|nr:hypothetical protein [Halomicroarcula nitratireducens]MBX0296899.1 hypothetical protein [Halomicroarcula nitratireducens]
MSTDQQQPADEQEPATETPDTPDGGTNPEAKDTTAPFTGPVPTQFDLAADVTVLKPIFEVAASLVEQCRIAVSADGLAMRAIDAECVSMLELRVDAASFDRFDVTEGVLGVNVQHVVDALSVGGAGDVGQLTLNASASELEVDVDGVTRTAELIPTESIRTPPSLPEIESPATCHISRPDLSFALSAASVLSERVEIDVDTDDGELRFCANGDVDSMVYRREPQELVAFEPADALARFETSRLRTIDRALPGESPRKLEVGQHNPVRLSAPFPDAEGVCQFMVAPKLPT